MAGDLLDQLLAAKAIESSDEFEMENEKLAPLLTEINYIQDQHIRLFTRAILVNAHNFWEIPSSFSGRFHPPDEHDPGGNVLHTKRVVRAAILFADAHDKNDREMDLLISACLLHDLTKGVDWGDKVGYDPMHPYTVERFIQIVRQADEEDPSENRSSTMFIEEEDLQTITRLIRVSHGRWSPIPETIPLLTLEWLIHYADNVASKLHWIIDGEDVNVKRWAVEDIVPPAEPDPQG